ncbi:MAG TPA: hypothetical protein VNL92_06295, partial [Dehalococcoidia bacterium]|nr:hypothetical protein [Dehalococcoidia bacterium]
MLLVTSASLLAGVAVFLVLSSLLVPSTRLLDRLPQAAAVAASTGKADRPAPFADRVVAPVVAALSETLGRVLPARIRERTQDQLEMAGRNRTDWTKFVALQVVAGVVLAGLALLMPFSAGLKVLFVPLLLFLGYRLPSFFVARSISKRNRQIERALPDAVDL